MPKVTVIFTLNSNTEKQDFSVVGIWKDKTLLFYDKQKNRHCVKIYDQYVHYTKRKETALEFYFEENRQRTGYYKVGDMEMIFDVVTTKLRLDEGQIDIVYKLKQNDVVVNDVSLKIEFFQVKEGKNGRI